MAAVKLKYDFFSLFSFIHTGVCEHVNGFVSWMQSAYVVPRVHVNWCVCVCVRACPCMHVCVPV